MDVEQTLQDIHEGKEALVKELKFLHIGLLAVSLMQMITVIVLLTNSPKK